MLDHVNLTQADRRTVEVRCNVEAASLVGCHGLMLREEHGRQCSDAELLEVLAGNDGLGRRRYFDAYAGSADISKGGYSPTGNGMGKPGANFGMPLASKMDTSFLAWLMVASVSLAKFGDVWVWTRPVR